MESHPYVSIVSPVYKAKNIVDQLVVELVSVLNTMRIDYEIILVDDSCPQNSWENILNECKKNQNIKGIKLSKNFGQHYAISAGLAAARGNWIVVMDCDLQDSPIEIPKLLKQAENGFDIVLARRQNRKDGFSKRILSKFFYFVLSYLTGQKIDNKIANFGIYHKKVISVLNNLGEKNRFFPTMIQKIGFKKSTIEVEHFTRHEGSSSYNLKKLLNLAFDIILSNSEKPIRLIVKFGLLISIVSFSFIIYNLIKYFSGSISVIGYSSIIVSICFFSGLIISFLGIIGLYIGKIFEEVKNRPLYIVEDKINF